MDLSLISNQIGGKLLLSSGVTTHHHRPPHFLPISCKATNRAMLTESTNLYNTLGLSSNDVGIDEIKRAYRAMSLKYHPDVCHPSTKEECVRIFVEVHTAYKTLVDPVSREEYDLRLSLGDFGRNNQIVNGNRFDRNIWEGQIIGLRRRPEKEGSWASILRGRNRGDGAIYDGI